MVEEQQQTKGTETVDERWDSLELARRIADFADDKKAIDTVILHVEEELQFADYFLITEGRNKRHLSAIAENVAKELKRHGIYRLAGTPFNDENWVVIDFGSVVVHVFSTDGREFYDLENLWGDCTKMEWTPKPAPGAPPREPASDD